MLCFEIDLALENQFGMKRVTQINATRWQNIILTRIFVWRKVTSNGKALWSGA
jgi:hypothetical protein